MRRKGKNKKQPSDTPQQAQSGGGGGADEAKQGTQSWSLVLGVCVLGAGVLALWLVAGGALEGGPQVPPGSHVCVGGGFVPVGQVNDGFCDCGSDEPDTSACAGWPSAPAFACANEGFFAQTVPASFVGDGLCDCCDGSDEGDDAGCENVCEAETKQQLGAAKQEARALARALRTKARMSEVAAAVQKGLREHSKVQDLEVDRRIKSLQARMNGGALSVEEENELRREANELSAEKGRVDLMKRLFRKKNAKKFFGNSLQYLPLYGRCVDKLWVQRRYGHMGAEEDRYVMQVCFFQNATQFTEASFKAFNGGQVELGDDGEEPDLSKFSLGLFSHWARVEARPQGAMHFRGGDQCWQGPKRSVAVEVRCGTEDKLVEVRENGKCVYEFVAESPAACLKKDLRAVQLRAKELKGYLEG